MIKESKTSTVKQSKKPLYISIAIIAALVLSYFFVPGVKDFLNETWDVLTSDDEKRIKSWVDQFGILGPLIIILCMILQMFLLVIPTPLLMVVTILAYGPFWGTAIILIAVFCASSAGYVIGSYFGPPVVEKLFGEKSEKKIKSFIEDYGFWAVFVTRISPFLSNDAISIVAGMLKMPYWQFIAATIFGITPLTVLIAYLGENNERLKSGLLWGSIVSFALLLLYVWLDKRRRNKQPSNFNGSHKK